MSAYVQKLMAEVKSRNPGEPEFHQTVQDLAESLEPVIEHRPEYRNAGILERIIEPERTIVFRICWTDDEGTPWVNRGYRVEMNGAIGPYKGGLRFHPSVNMSVFKFLALEQVFKNSLTTLPLGGGHGGSDFSPKGKSDQEIMRFCRSFMDEMYRHIGANTDVPDGDIGVSGREIGYLFGHYRKLKNEFTGVLTGKGLSWGGSLMGTEATGYGVVYFAEEMLARQDESLADKTCLVSGCGKVALSTIEKLVEIGARVITFSDTCGSIHDPEGVNREKLEWLKELKNVRRGSVREYAEEFRSAEFTPVESGVLDESPVWHHEAECAFPCARQHEIGIEDAKALLQNGIRLIVEGANMPITAEAAKLIRDHSVLYAPGKAANAGGAAVSGLEMAQNSMHYSWTREEVDRRLQIIMKNIHERCVEAADEFGVVGDYVAGANIAGFIRVADAMVSQGG